MIGILKPNKTAKEPQDWTAEEIEQAKRLSRALIVRLFDEGKCSPVFCVIEDVPVIAFFKAPAIIHGLPLLIHQTLVLRYQDCQDGCFFALPSINDVFNVDIGKCVCLCKATGTPIPDFIKNKNM